MSYKHFTQIGPLSNLAIYLEINLLFVHTQEKIRLYQTYWHIKQI